MLFITLNFFSQMGAMSLPLEILCYIHVPSDCEGFLSWTWVDSRKINTLSNSHV